MKIGVTKRGILIMSLILATHAIINKPKVHNFMEKKRMQNKRTILSKVNQYLKMKRRHALSGKHEGSYHRFAHQDDAKRRRVEHRSEKKRYLRKDGHFKDEKYNFRKGRSHHEHGGGHNFRERHDHSHHHHHEMGHNLR